MHPTSPHVAKKSFDLFYQSVMGVVDFFSIYLGYFFAYKIYSTFFGTPPQSWEEISLLALIPSGIAVFTLMISTVYRCSPGPMELDRLRRILSGYFWSQIFTFSLTFFAKSSGYSRLMVGIAFILGIINILIGRALFSRLLRPLRANLGLRRVLIVGAGKIGKTLARNLVNSPGEAVIVGFLDDQFPEMKSSEIKVGEKTFRFDVLGKLQDLGSCVKERKVNEVIMAITQASHGFHQTLIEESRNLGVHYSIVPSAIDLMLTGAEAYSIGHIPLFRMGDKTSLGLSPFIKRALDILGALAIAILCSPIWILSAIAVRLDSPGPVLFVHDRVGKDGKIFKLFKFRSMYINTSPYSVTPGSPMTRFM
jgi:FlaA1/EpsC-like NDP-sugar epimerase